MKVTPETLKHFRMSALAAVISLRRYLRDHPGTAPNEAANALRRLDADYAGADYETGLHLHSIFDDSIDFTDPKLGLRDALTVLVRLHQPWWCKLAPYGRQRLATALTMDELQTFRSAGLMDVPPSYTTIQWWDALAAEMRAVSDEQRTAQGRYAEQLSLRHEQRRLRSLGIHEHPRWVAIEDNGAGYDILSYDQTPYGLKNRLIEVKSTTQDEARLFLTRGEWETALKFGEAYQLHIWKLPSEELIIKSAAEISQHIPSDSGGGVWQKVEIIL